MKRPDRSGRFAGAMMKKILVAVGQESIQGVTNALKGHYDLVCCTSLEEARSALDKSIDLVLCGLHFDEGRMLDFLRYAKADPSTRPIPFICIKIAEGMLSQAIIQSIEIASRALGADRFVDLHEWIIKLGDTKAYE